MFTSALRALLILKVLSCESSPLLIPEMITGYTLGLKGLRTDGLIDLRSLATADVDGRRICILRIRRRSVDTGPACPIFKIGNS